MEANAVIDLRNVSIYHPRDSFREASFRKRKDRCDLILSDVNLTVCPGELIYLIGRVGSGKSSLLKTLYAELPLVEGEGWVAGFDLTKIRRKDVPYLRRRMGIVFQDYQLLTDRDVFHNLQFVLKATGWKNDMEIKNQIAEVLHEVGLVNKEYKMPFQLSGGQRQRVMIAMALSCNPELVIADEPTTALDVTIQAQVLRMMSDLKKKFGTSMIIITHDLGVVAKTCDKVAIMYAGEIIEYGTVEDIFLGERHHPYTIGLFRSLPDMNEEAERLHPIDGLMPDPIDLPEGCKFHPRCPECMEICRSISPMQHAFAGHHVKCHLFDKEQGS